MRRAFLLANLAASLVLFAVVAHAEPNWTLIEKTLIAEAASEGEAGMYAVGCVMRNRGWNLNGFSGSRRQYLEHFVRRQPAKLQAAARRCVGRLRAGVRDVTLGATHFENVASFGIPRWARGRKPLTVIGRHTFWRIEE